MPSYTRLPPAFCDSFPGEEGAWGPWEEGAWGRGKRESEGPGDREPDDREPEVMVSLHVHCSGHMRQGSPSDDSVFRACVQPLN